MGAVFLSSKAGVHKKGTFTLQDAINNIKQDPNYPKAGAISVFIGVVRGETLDGEKVERLELEAYEEKATQVLNQICEELTKRPGIVNVQIHHLLGEFGVGEEMVYVTVAGSHRTDLFTVLREAVDRYKNEAPIFKKERIIDQKGSVREYWVSEKHGH